MIWCVYRWIVGYGPIVWIPLFPSCHPNSEKSILRQFPYFPDYCITFFHYFLFLMMSFSVNQYQLACYSLQLTFSCSWLQMSVSHLFNIYSVGLSLYQLSGIGWFQLFPISGSQFFSLQLHFWFAKCYHFKPINKLYVAT